MRIWCCSCFTVNDDEEEEKGRLTEGIETEEMSGPDFGNEGEGEEGEEESAARVPLNDDFEQADKGNIGGEGGGGAVGGRNWDLEHADELRICQGLLGNATYGNRPGWREGGFARTVFCCGAPGMARGEHISGSAFSAAAAEGGVGVSHGGGDDEEGCDRDSHNKRVKVYSGSNDYPAMSSDAGNSSSSAKRDFNLSHGCSENENFYQNFSWNNSSDDNNYDLGDGRDDGDGRCNSKTEDFEIRMDLTDDLLHMVFSFLDLSHLCRAAMVCRQWRVASAHEDFWRCLNFKNRLISVDQFEDMCRRYPNASEVNICAAPAIQSLVMKAVSSLRNLEVLTLGGGGQIGDPFFHALADCSSLRSLNINDATLGSGIQEIPINHDRLRHLQVKKCRVMRISVRCPLLETLSLKRSNMAQTVLNCPLLHLLDIGSCHKLSDAAIRSAATSCPQLQSLDMSNCSCVSDETLREVALTCANLHILNASYCPNISLESVRLPTLTVLKLHSCEGITSASMTAISHSYTLEVLELDNCGLLTSVSLDLPLLQNIRLVHCRKFSDLNLRSAMLSSIMVSNCPALHHISISSDLLQKLALQKQENLTSLALQCQSLQEVDLTDCESLTNAICDVFGDGGGCPKLKSLVLDNCESLTAVRFCSTSLTSLSLVGCRAITSLDLTCPWLEQVLLDGCDHLERASFCPVALRSLNLGICPKLAVLRIEAPYLLSLELKGCGVLSEASINCPLLTTLDASFCSQLRDECLSATTVSCMLIESLILMSCPSVGSDGLYSLRSLLNLTVLDLSYTFLMDLQPVFESCMKLKVLKLQACKYLTDNSLEPLYKEGALPLLQELDLSYGTLCQTAIEELLACSTHLTHLSLNGCMNLHDLNWGCAGGQLVDLPSVCSSSAMIPDENFFEPTDQPNRLLQNLNCVGCSNIRKVLIPPAARCFHLSTLNLSLSSNLKEVDVACFNLSFLNLSNCHSLETLRLKCPRLTILFLQSCNIDEEAVQAAISDCGMLETLDVRYCSKICSISTARLRAACPSLKRVFKQPVSSI